MPNTIPEVINRIFNLGFSSKLTLDRKLFRQTNDCVSLFDTIKALITNLEGIPELLKQYPELDQIVQKIQSNEGYKTLGGHYKIDYITLIPFTAGPELADASDFSKATIEARIKAGAKEAERHSIGTPQRVLVN